MKTIDTCRVCQKKNLKEAFGVDNTYYVFCKDCWTLQRKDDIPYQIDFYFAGGFLEVVYYPAFLRKHDVAPLANECIFFSLKALEFLLNIAGYDATSLTLEGYTLKVYFQPTVGLEQLRRKEKGMKLDSQSTFLLWAMQLKNKAKML